MFPVSPVFNFSCPDKRADDDLEESLQSILSDQGLHKTLIAKKFHEKRSQGMVNVRCHFFSPFNSQKYLGI